MVDLHCLSSVNILTDFYSETSLPISVKFHMQPLGSGGTKICWNGPGHMTKMAFMPKYGKNLKKSSPEPLGQLA